MVGFYKIQSSEEDFIMACTPFNPAVGQFVSYAWGLVSPNPWNFAPKQGNNETYQLKKNGVVADELWIPNAASVRWIFFPGGNFLIVRNATNSGGMDDYRFWVFDLRNAAVTHYDGGGGPWSLSAGAQFNFHASPDGMAFFLFAADSMPNSTKQHIVFRSDTGDLLCSWGQIFNVQAPRIAEISNARTIRILTSPDTLYTECPLPSGKCDVQPHSQNFQEAVVGGPAALAKTTKQFTIKNTGNDCMRVSSIADAAPFTVTSTSKPLPADLGAGDSMTVTVTFSPVAVGNFGPTNLMVACTPVNGDDKLICSGNARAPIKKLTLVPGSLSFGKQPAGSSTPKTLKLRNDGEVQLSVSVAASPAGISFTWAAYNGNIAVGNAQDIAVTFKPIAEGPASATLTVNDATSGNAQNVALSGSGCVANAEMIVPPAPFPVFGQVQRGFRMVRLITVKNTGDGQLTFTARIDGADKALFGQMQSLAVGSVVNVVNTRVYSVDPVSPCGAGSSGSGETEVAVVFFANDQPRLANAQLIIEAHNATNAIPASISFPLSAEIIASVAVDAALVLDRSGSMSEAIGTRTKVEAAVAGGKLFAELIRPDLDDRLTVVKYDENIDVLQPIVSITSANQPGIVAKINSNELLPLGTTAIAGGVMVALGQLATPRPSPPPALTRAMVVLTDGMDNTAYQNPADGKWYSILGGNSENPVGGGMVATEAFPIPADVKIYGIGLGKEEDIDKAALNRLSTATGAYYGGVSDLVGPDYFSLEKYFTQIYMDVVDLSSISDPVYTIAPGQKQKIEFDVLQGDISALVVLFDYDGMRLPFKIVSPKGEVIESMAVPPGFQLRVGSTTTARFVEFLMPRGEPQRYAGRWAVIIEHRGEVCSGDIASKQEMRRGFLPYRCRKYDRPVDYGIAIGVGSNFRMQAYVTPAPVCVGDPILLTAVVREAGLPVVGCTVTVKAVAPSGAMWNLTLFDDGIHSDGEKDDGEYARNFTQTAEAGTYEFTFRAVGMSRDGEPVTREAVRAKYVEGRIVIDPNGGRPGEPNLCCERMLKLLAKLLEGKAGTIAVEKPGLGSVLIK